MRRALAPVFLLLAGCAAQGPAPVTERGATDARRAQSAPRAATRAAPRQIEASRTGQHTVQTGDTLYGIAFANGLDYQTLAAWNDLASVDMIYVGQVLRLTSPDNATLSAKGVEIQPLDTDLRPRAQPLADPPLLSEPQGILLPYSEANWAQATAARTRPAPEAAVAKAEPVAKPAEVVPPPVPAAVSIPPVTRAPGNWLWPAQGTLKGRFGAGGGKGIDIEGTRNTPVLAVAPGRVVYSGSGLRGYGRLLILKHAGEFLSAYAHNQDMLVKEGDTVTAGQKIALMGDSGADRVKLHFEIRQYGRPLDPLKYLTSPQ